MFLYGYTTRQSCQNVAEQLVARASQWSRDLNYSDPTERDWGLLITEHARLRSFKMARTVKLSGGFELSCRIY